jgi:hypothetical protein
MVGNGAAPMRNDETQIGKILEQIRGQELHERRCIGVEIMRAGGMEVGIVRRADVDHGRNVELHQLLVERIPPAIRERRVGPVPARRIRIEIAADQAERFDAALELGHAIRRRHARRLRQLANADEIVGIEPAAAMDQIVADLRPCKADVGIADVVAHAGGPRREDSEVGAAFALKFELQLQALANLVVADVQVRIGRLGPISPGGDLPLPKNLELSRRRRVVAVTIDDHDVLGGC